MRDWDRREFASVLWPSNWKTNAIRHSIRFGRTLQCPHKICNCLNNISNLSLMCRLPRAVQKMRKRRFGRCTSPDSRGMGKSLLYFIWNGRRPRCGGLLREFFVSAFNHFFSMVFLFELFLYVRYIREIINSNVCALYHIPWRPSYFYDQLGITLQFKHQCYFRFVGCWLLRPFSNNKQLMCYFSRSF